MYQEYKEKLGYLSRIEGFKGYQIQAAMIIQKVYDKELTKRGLPTNGALILVGGLSLTVYTKSEYVTDDIDLIVGEDKVFGYIMGELGFSKQGRMWFKDDNRICVETPSPPFAGNLSKLKTVYATYMNEPYTLTVQGVEDIFLDRLRGFVEWDEQDYLRQLDLIFRQYGEQMDYPYIESQLETHKQLKAYNRLIGYFRDRTERSVMVTEVSQLYVDLTDGSIDLRRYNKQTPTLVLADAMIINESEYSVYGKGTVALIAHYIGRELLFTQGVKAYGLNKDADTGFTLGDIKQMDGVDITKEQFLAYVKTTQRTGVNKKDLHQALKVYKLKYKSDNQLVLVIEQVNAVLVFRVVNRTTVTNVNKGQVVIDYQTVKRRYQTEDVIKLTQYIADELQGHN